MRIHWLTCAIASVPSLLLAAATAPSPVLDKAQLEQYLRYAEGFTPDVHFRFDDPAPSPYPGFFV